MAQDSADLTRIPLISIDSEGSQPEILEIQGTEASGSGPPMASIDTLLALTDEGWDIDDQVRTLKDAAAEQEPQGRGEPAPALKPPASHAPPLPPRERTRKASIPPPLPSSGSKLTAPPSRRVPPPLPRVASESVRQETKAPEPRVSAPLVDLLSARVSALEEGSDRISL